MSSRLYPFTFEPIFKERIWGGRNIERLYRKPLPPGKRIGESWEITDRPEGVSRITNGALAGRDLRWLMENRREELLGSAQPVNNKFPLLIKILDAQDVLSLQVHPPAAIAAALGGDPKTEMWYIADATPDATLYVGLKRGVTRQEFERKTQDGTVADCFHAITVRPGDAMFLPSGRVHAIGAGNIIFEIQQNSDTTFRVFDWNRLDDQGRPRELHIAQSLASIDFNDFEPDLISTPFLDGPIKTRELVNDPLFDLTEHHLPAGAELHISDGKLRVVGVVSGNLSLAGGGETLNLGPGQFALIPASVDMTHVHADRDATLLSARA